MGSLISREALVEVITNVQEHMREANVKPVPVDAREIFTLFIEMVNAQPPVEAVPVVHGTWVNTDGYDEWECDNCGYLICGYDDEPSKGEMKFCNMCGADMRKKVKQNERKKYGKLNGNMQ